MERIEIDENEPLQPGDIIEMHCRTIGLTWLTAAQVAILEWKLKGQPNFQLVSSTYSGNRIVLKIRIIEPAGHQVPMQKAGVVSAALIIKVVAAVSIGVLAWLSLDKIYKIVESPAGKIGVAGLGTMALTAGIGGLLAILSKSK